MDMLWAIDQASALKELLDGCGVTAVLADLISWPTIKMDSLAWPRARDDLTLFAEERLALRMYSQTPNFVNLGVA